MIGIQMGDEPDGIEEILRASLKRARKALVKKNDALDKFEWGFPKFVELNYGRQCNACLVREGEKHLPDCWWKLAREAK